MTPRAHRHQPGGGRGADREADRATDRGAASTELVLVMPVLIAFLSLVVVSGRLTDAKGDVVSAASDAARAATLQTSQGAAVTQAQAIAADTLAGEGIECVGGADVDITFDPGFQPGATVEATVRCNVATGDLAMLNLPGVVTVTERAWEPIDRHRSQ